MNLPKEIITPTGKYYQDKNDSEYYNLAGKEHFERIHISKFSQNTLDNYNVHFKKEWSKLKTRNQFNKYDRF